MIDTEGKYIIQECVICYNEYNIENAIIFDCNHHICLKCYETLINKFYQLSCPLCRRIIEITPEPPPRLIRLITRNDLCKLIIYFICIGIIITHIIIVS